MSAKILSGSRSTGALRGLATPEKYSRYPLTAALVSPSKLGLSPSAAAAAAHHGARTAPTVAGALTEFLSSPTGAGSAALAATKELLGACTAPEERARLLQQVSELRTECDRLLHERKAEEERLASQGAGLTECQGLCRSAAATLGKLERQLAEAEREFELASQAGGELERSAEETRAQLAIAARVEAEQRQRLRAALLAADQATAGLAAEQQKAAGLSEKLHELDPQMRAAFNSQASGVAAVAALGLDVIEARKRAQAAQQDERAAQATASQAASELKQAKDELDALSVELAETESRRLASEGAVRQLRATTLQAGLARERADAASAELAKASAEAAGAATTTLELLTTTRELEAQRALLAQSVGSEAACCEAARRERQQEAQEVESASQTARKIQAATERASAENEARQGERQSAEAATDLAHAELRDEIARARSAVAGAAKNLEAIRLQVKEQHEAAERVRASTAAAGSSATELKERAALRQATHAAIEKKLGAALAELETAQRMRSAAAADGEACLAAAERETRQVAEEIRRVGTEQTLKAEAARAEEEKRAELERRLRGELTSVEHAWHSLKRELESRNADTATQALKLDRERQEAEAMMLEAEGAVRRFQDSHIKQTSQLQHQIEHVVSRSTQQEAAARSVAEALHGELGAMAVEHGQAQAAVRQQEALNAGLRAQLGALQH